LKISKAIAVADISKTLNKINVCHEIENFFEITVEEPSAKCHNIDFPRRYLRTV